jgi:murein DD-endopeptidase MepM/ murein hydrolase activator NlpD
LKKGGQGGFAVKGLIFSFAAALLLSPLPVQADFYKYVGDDGVETFTNTPTTNGAVKVLREGKAAPARKREAKLLPRTYLPQVPPAAKSELAAPAQPLPDKGRLLPVHGTVTSSVGWRHDPIDGLIRHHNGVDLAVPSGSSVRAIAAGVVVESAWHGGYGNLVTIDHGNGMISMYGHNSKLEVKTGDRVEAGQIVALSGSTGRSTGPHLHFELWQKGSNVTETYLGGGTEVPEVKGGIRSYLHKDGSLVFTNM